MIDQKTIDAVIGYIDDRRKHIERAEGRQTVLSRGPYLSAWDDVRTELAMGAVQDWAMAKESEPHE